MRFLVFVGGPALLSFVIARAAVRLRIPQLTHRNHRGRPVPAVLGMVVAASALPVLAGAVAGLALREGAGTATWHVLWVLEGALLVTTAGLIDDLREGDPRGIRGHLASLARGRPTTGALKIAAAIGGALMVTEGLGDRGVVVAALGIVTIAGAANVWNGLDVSPGRAGKWFYVAALPVLLAGPRTAPWGLLLVLAGAEGPALALDLRERGMLGDAGSNLLGFAVGAGLYAVLPVTGLAVAATLVVLLNVLAETVTFSRLLGAVPPLRAFDRAGQLRDAGDFSGAN